MASDTVVATAMSTADAQAIGRARAALDPATRRPEVRPLETLDREAALSDRKHPLVAILEGPLASPRLVGPQAQIDRWAAPMALLAAQARDGLRAPPVPVATQVVQGSSG